MSISKKEAKKIIIEFINKYKGKNVLFNNLDEGGKRAYVLTKTFNYARSFLTVGEALERAINNTEAHERENFNDFTSKINENMTIAKE